MTRSLYDVTLSDPNTTSDGTCSNCGTENDPTFRFCRDCATEINR